MNAEGIQNIIRLLAKCGRSSVVEYGMHGSRTAGIAFQARFPEWEADGRPLCHIPEAVTVARMVLAQGWEALNLLPELWYTQSVWDVIDDPRHNLAVRKSLLRRAVYVTHVAGEGQNGIVGPGRLDARPEIQTAAARFQFLFPKFGLLGLPPRPRQRRRRAAAASPATLPQLRLRSRPGRLGCIVGCAD